MCLALSASAQDAGNEKKAPEPFKLQMVKIGNTYQGLKHKLATGETWQIFDDAWVKVVEPAPCPAGDYQITLIPSEMGFNAIRIERQTGATALMSSVKQKWLPVGEAKGAAVPAKNAARDGKGFELRYVRVKDQLHVIRFHTGTGATAHIGGDTFDVYPETNPIPAGNYEVTMIATKDSWIAFRFDQATGTTWLLQGNKWNKITDPE